MKRWSTIVLTALLGAVATLSAGAVLACSFHAELPERTTTDILLESANIVVAREDRSRPFHFSPVEVLRGSPPSGTLQNFIDSSTRRRLAANPEHGVVLAQSEPGGSWTRVAYLDERLRPHILAIVDKTASWADDPAGTDRFRFFAALHDHPDINVRRLALAELDRVAYRHLRSMGVRLPAAALRKGLLRFNEAPWAPVRILLLGILGDAESRLAVNRAIEAAARHRFAVNLGPWATAAIEIDGVSAVDRLRELFLQDRDARPEQLKAVLEALALHGSRGDPALRPLIDSAIADLLTARPALAGETARIFAAHGDFSRVAVFERLFKSGKLNSVPALIGVVSYVSLARKQMENLQRPTKD